MNVESWRSAASTIWCFLLCASSPFFLLTTCRGARTTARTVKLHRDIMLLSGAPHQRRWSGPKVAAVVAGVSAASLLALWGWRRRQRLQAAAENVVSTPVIAASVRSSGSVGKVSSVNASSDSAAPAESLLSSKSVPPVDTPDRRRGLEMFRAVKEQATRAFQCGQWDTALQHYQDAVDVLAALPADDEVVALGQVIRANVVQVFLNLGRFDEARMLATFLIQDEQRSLMPVELLCKVLYRRAAAMKQLQDFNGAVGDLLAIKHFSKKEDAMVESELAAVQKSMAQQAKGA